MGTQTGRYALIVAAAALATAGALTWRGARDVGSEPAPEPSRAWSVESSTIELGDQPYALDLDGDTVWVSGGRGSLLEVRGREVVVHPHPTGPLGVAVHDGIVWATGDASDRHPLSDVRGIDARSGEVVRRVRLPRESPYGIDAGPGGVFVALYDGRLLRIRPGGARTTRVALGEGLTQVLAAHGAIWVSQPGGGKVWRVELDGGTADAEAISPGPRRTCPQGSDASETVVLVADPCAGKVWLLDPRDGTPLGELGDVGRRPVDVAVAGGLVYVVSVRDDEIIVLDETTRREVARAAAGEGAAGVVAGPRGAWVANNDETSLTKIVLERPRR